MPEARARKNRVAPSLDTLERRDAPSTLSLVAYPDYIGPYAELYGPSIFMKPIKKLGSSIGNRVVAFAKSNQGQTVKWQPQYFGDEQCTDLVLAALNSARAKTNADFGTVGNN